MGKIAVCDILALYRAGKHFAMTSCYDFTVATLVEKSRFDAILVDKCLSQVFYGRPDGQVPSLSELLYALKAVRVGAPTKFLVADLPCEANGASIAEIIHLANCLVKEGGCDCIRIEARPEALDAATSLVRAGIQVISDLTTATGPIADIALDFQKAGTFACFLPAALSGFAEKLSVLLNTPIITEAESCIGCGRYRHFYDFSGLRTVDSPLSRHCIELMNQFHADIQSGQYPSSAELFEIDVHGITNIRNAIRRGEPV